jgi:hypothetical protein
MKRRDVLVHECRVVFVQSREMTATHIQSCRGTHVSNFLNGNSDKLHAVGLRNPASRIRLRNLVNIELT